MRYPSLLPAALAVAALLATESRADPIVKLCGLALPDPLTHVQFYSFSAGSQGRENWASQQIQSLRTRSGRMRSLEDAFFTRANSVFSADPYAGTDSIGVEPANDVEPMGQLALEGSPGIEELLFGKTGLRGALIGGFDTEDLPADLPAFAMTAGSLYGALSAQGRNLMVALGRFLGFDRKLKMKIDADLTVAEDKKAKDERKRRSTGEPAANEGPQGPDVTMRQVVRSVFKIILGAILGALMFMLVRRRE